MKTVHVFLEGSVQGVFFRSFIESEAKKSHLKGFVRNMSDGRVEAVFQGDEDKIKEILKLCEQGPGRVSKIIVNSYPTKNFEGFCIKR